LQGADDLNTLMTETSRSTEREMTVRNIKIIKITKHLLVFHM